MAANLQAHLRSQDDDIAIYEWDAVNRLLRTTNEGNGASFRYRADGLRVEKVSGLAMVYIQNEEDDSGFYDDNLAVNKPTTRWYYDGQMGMEDDYRTKPNLTLPDQYTVNRYGLGARGIDSISRYYGTPSSFSLEEVSYPVYDGHGNMVLTVRRNGSSFTTHDERRYDVWGSVRAGSGASSQRYCASLGHVSDDESGLIYMRARYYEPGSGRFVSEDPARDGLNWYAYCGNDPGGKVDPSGKFSLVDLMSGAANEVYEKFLEVQQANRTLSWAESAIQRALTKWAEKVAPEIVEALYGDSLSLLARESAKGIGIQITGVASRYGIGIVVIGNQIEVKTYLRGDHIDSTIKFAIEHWWGRG